jgi:hypothetical protein
LESSKFEVYGIGYDILCGWQWILHDCAIVEHDFSFNVYFCVFVILQLEDTELKAIEQV